MFTSGEGSSLQDQSGAAGEIFVPTRFVWPHGGRRVLLTGTFTRWSGLVPMSPVEGCPTVFQVVYPVSLGAHQYKFNVDGQWRHDDNQPHATGDYGIVNTVVLAQEHVSGTGTMDVDNEQLHPLVAESGGSMQAAAGSSISESDLEQSRHRFSSFLSSHIAYELLPESGKVTALDVNLPVKQAFHILYEKGISMAPLWDFFRGQFVGVLSALDFILILREVGSNGLNLSEEELETHTISAWKEGKRQLYGHVDEQGRPVQRHLIHAGPYDTLRDVALRILQNEVATVPIIHSSTEDGLFPQLLHVSSLSEILRCVCRHFRHSSSSLPVLQRPICTLPLGTWVPKVGESRKKPLTMLQPHTSLSSALTLLIQARVSSLPIVDDNGSLLDIYSRSDITTLAKDRAYAHIRLDEMSIDQALQLGRDTISPHGYINGDRFQMCLRTDPLLIVMELLANPGVRRIIIVEAGSRRVEGIISLSDVFRFFLG